MRSALTCTSATGICGMCYGRSMATGKLVDVGEAVGIVAAQSIGEPGTQLTMRTFHTGGVAGDDITTGLPRVQELFEARVPKGKAPIADVDGRIAIEDGDRFWKITLTPDDGGEEIVYEKLSKRQWLAMTTVDGQERPLADGDHVHVGQLLLEGTADPHEVLRVMGPREVQLHLVREVQKVYRTQSVDIHDKHIEVIVRQMLRRVTIIDSGATEFLPGALAERADFETQNRQVVAEGGEPASGRPVLMGITKASLATESWLSAASFQETTRILTDAAINGKRDKLVGLKENVIIGKLIPAGTGINRYRNIQVQPTEEARAAAYALPSYDDGYYSPDVFGTGTGAAVPLDDYDFGATTVTGRRRPSATAEGRAEGGPGRGRIPLSRGGVRPRSSSDRLPAPPERSGRRGIAALDERHQCIQSVDGRRLHTERCRRRLRGADQSVHGMTKVGFGRRRPAPRLECWREPRVVVTGQEAGR